MKELVEVIAKSLVDDPDSVVVTEREEKKATVLELRVADSDMGKVIGKQGRESDPRGGQSSGSQRRQESDRRYYGLRKGLPFTAGWDRRHSDLSRILYKETAWKSYYRWE